MIKVFCDQFSMALYFLKYLLLLRPPKYSSCCACARMFIRSWGVGMCTQVFTCVPRNMHVYVHVKAGGQPWVSYSTILHLFDCLFRDKISWTWSSPIQLDGLASLCLPSWDYKHQLPCPALCGGDLCSGLPDDCTASLSSLRNFHSPRMFVWQWNFLTSQWSNKIMWTLQQSLDQDIKIPLN